MIWHDIRDPNDPELDRVAEQYKLHPLHIEDCRHRDQAAKVEQQNSYVFVVLKPFDLDEEFRFAMGDLDVFVHTDFVITVEESGCRTITDALSRLRARSEGMRADQILHKIVDEVVDSYMPLIDRVGDRIDELQDSVIDPNPFALQKIFEVKRALVDMRRVLINTRDVIGSLQRLQGTFIQADMQPFFRDVYDHIARSLDLVETYRDLLGGSMDIYLSSVSNRTNQVMKVLTVISTIALPTLMISGFYGMNLRHLPWADHPHAWWIVTAIIASITAVLLGLLRWFRWL